MSPPPPEHGGGPGPDPDEPSAGDPGPAEGDVPDGGVDPDDGYDPDDLSGMQTPFSRFVQRTRGWLAAAVVIALVLPAGGWAIDEFAFGRSGDAVEEELGDDAWLAESVLLVRAVDCAGRVSTGSAFAVQLDGEPTLLTNRHVVESARSVGLRRLDGGPAITVAEHRIADGPDVAVLELADPDELPAALPVGGPVDRGDEVRTIGFPAGRPTVTEGAVASAELGLLQLAMPVAPGASGSPVMDLDGLVVGQVFGRSSDGDGVATALDALTAGARAARPAPPC